MCGIVSFFGRSDGVRHVLDALQLLEYRAPDSAGLAVLDEAGELAVRRAVGGSRQLQATLAENPLPDPRPGPPQIVVGHGRWAMVGAVTVPNAHPISDRSRSRVVVENGSHNARLMLGLREEQEAWWRARESLPAGTPIHRCANTTEVISYEWERIAIQLEEGQPPAGSADFLEKLDEWGIDDTEERAARLAMWRVQGGNAHACALYSRHRPDTLYVTAHNKAIAIAIRTYDDGHRELMVASDVNAALMLWPKAEVDAAATAIQSLRKTGGDEAAIREILQPFTVDVIFLDADVAQGKELFARITDDDGPQVAISRYDGTPVAVPTRPVQLNPAMVGKGTYASYTEAHIAEIPEVMDRIVQAYVREGQVQLDSVWQEGELLAPGLNVAHLQQRFGEGLDRLDRLLLVGEGSSWRDAQAAAPLFRGLLPGVVVNVYRPVQVLNLGPAIDPARDLAVEISWSGTTDSLLKVDGWLAETDVLRLVVTGRAQSDLGRRAAGSGGTLNVHSGIEVSVATVKGYQAILMTLDLLALQLFHLTNQPPNQPTTQPTHHPTQLLNDLTLVVPRHVRAVIEDRAREERIRRVAERCRHFNKVAVVGSSPIDVEAELKIEELAQVVAIPFDFTTASLRSLIERSALVDDDRQRTLFIVNATTPEARRAARPVIAYLRALGVFCLIHTTPDGAKMWRADAHAEVFVTPAVSEPLQPLLDAPFFFKLAVALAYARGLSPEEVDRPRNLAKSVTTTGAERRDVVEARQEFRNVSLAEFGSGRDVAKAWADGPTRAALRATVALRVALSVIREPLPPHLDLDGHEHLVVVTDTEATENGAHMAAAAWQELLGIDLTVYRRFVSELPRTRPGTAALRLIRSGAILTVHDGNTISLPADMTPLQLEILSAVYLTGLAVRLARQRGAATEAWEAGLARLPLILAGVLDDATLAQRTLVALGPFVNVGYDKLQVIGGGQDFAAAASIARSLRMRGFMAEALYTDSAWHGPLATVGGPDADHDTLVVILATDPLFQAAALVDTQVYRTRHAPVLLVVPEGNQTRPVVRGVDASDVLAVPAVPRPFTPVVGAVFGEVLAQQMARLWDVKEN